MAKASKETIRKKIYGDPELLKFLMASFAEYAIGDALANGMDISEISFVSTLMLNFDRFLERNVPTIAELNKRKQALAIVNEVLDNNHRGVHSFLSIAEQSLHASDEEEECDGITVELCNNDNIKKLHEKESVAK